MPKFSGSAPIGPWECLCGRKFTRSRKCLNCGDELPYLVAAGVITLIERSMMSNEDYEDFIVERAVKQAISVMMEEGWLEGESSQ